MSARFMQVSIWDFIDFHLRDLRALRGNPTPPTTVENRYIGDLRSGVSAGSGDPRRTPSHLEHRPPAKISRIVVRKTSSRSLIWL